MKNLTVVHVARQHRQGGLSVKAACADAVRSILWTLQSLRLNVQTPRKTVYTAVERQDSGLRTPAQLFLWHVCDIRPKRAAPQGVQAAAQVSMPICMQMVTTDLPFEVLPDLR